MKNRALLRIDPQVLFYDLTAGAYPDAIVKSVGVGQDGLICFEVLGTGVPEGEASLIYETRATVSGGRAVLFKELAGR